VSKIAESVNIKVGVTYSYRCSLRVKEKMCLLCLHIFVLIYELKFLKLQRFTMKFIKRRGFTDVTQKVLRGANVAF
jgi:hypothetical protein